MKKDFPRPKHNEHTDSYHTDDWIKAMFPIAYDPCPYDPDWHYNGLRISWEDSCRELADFFGMMGKCPVPVFVNPPYSKPLPWIKKAIEEYQSPYISAIIMLLKHDSSTEWYRLLHEAGARFLLVNKRLQYGTGKAAAFPSVLAILTNDEPKGKNWSSGDDYV